MKSLSSFSILPFFCVFLLGTSTISAQQSKGITPLLRPDTIVAVHLNLKNFDFDRFVQGKIDRIDNFFLGLNYDDDSRETICREAKTLLKSKLNLIRPLYQLYIMGTKLDEIMLVSYSGNLKNAPLIIATPLEGKTPNQIALLESFFNDAPIKPFQAEGFLILAIPGSPEKGEEAAQWVKTHLAETSSAPLPAVQEAFRWFSDDVILRGIVIKPNNFQELLKSVDLSDLPPQAVLTTDIFLDKVQWAAFGVNPYTCWAGLTVQTSTQTDAEELRELIYTAQDAGAEALRIGLQSGIVAGAEDQPALVFLTEYIPLLTEIARGALRKTLPQIDGTKLIFATCE